MHAVSAHADARSRTGPGSGTRNDATQTQHSRARTIMAGEAGRDRDRRCHATLSLAVT